MMNQQIHTNVLHWMAVYTFPRAEKKVSERLGEAGFEHYLPLKRVKRRWSDRVKWIDFPVIPSYVFVQCCPAERDRVLQTDGVVQFVRNRGVPAVIRDEEMERMWKFLADINRMIRCEARFEPGKKVKIEAGPLRGNRGEVLYTKDTRVCINLTSIGLQIRAEVEAALVSELNS